MDLKELLSGIPGWLGFLLLIIVGALMAVHGIFNPLGAALSHASRMGFIVFGLCALLVGAFSWIVGANSQIRGREGVVGVKVAISDLPWWGFVVDGGLVVLAIVLFLALK